LPGALRTGLGTAIESVPIRAWDAIGAALPRAFRFPRLGDRAHKVADRLKHVKSIDDLYRVLVTTWPAQSNVVPGAKRLRTILDERDWLPDADVEERMMMWDALTYLPDDILQKVDRASMGVSLETRAPFLDHRVAELAWRVPLDMKIRNGTTKWILRELLHRYVPQELTDWPKMGFGLPIETWLRGPLHKWADDLLDESTMRSQGFFDPAPIRQKWAEHLSGTRNWHQELWCVLMFQAWVNNTE
jgi:asparagine synthase (glutamine-hydrolysing)